MKKSDNSVILPQRTVPAPAGLSEAALVALATPQPALGPFPSVDDKEGWRHLIAQRDSMFASVAAPFVSRLQVDTDALSLDGVPVYKSTPRDARLVNTEQVILDIHGGGLVYFSGEANVRYLAASMALRTGRVTYSLDYRVPPDHPYPAALDDCLKVYRSLLAQWRPQQIVITGISAGGNLGAALLLRANAEGLPMPAGIVLLTPQLDLAESGDSFTTLNGLDTVLAEEMMPLSLLYANGEDLTNPFVSPLFGDVDFFPPTFLQAGTRDLFLSNAVRFHRKLRKTGVRAELHVWDGMPHGGFGGVTLEDKEITSEVQLFLASLEQVA